MLDPVTATALGAGATKAIEKTSSSFVEKISLKFAKDKYEQLVFVLNKGLPSYLAANYAKCNTLKTLLNRNDPVELEDCFVGPDFETENRVSSTEEFLSEVNASSGKYVITGLAGSGKSVFLKYAFTKTIELGHTYYPIFFELRALNRTERKKDLLLSNVFDSIKSCCPEFTRAQFNYGLKSGAFYFLFDGFDELSQDIREQIADEICSLSRDQYKCAALITSRPSDEFVSWEGFKEVKLLPFDLDKSVEYISKLRFDEEKKQDFIADLEIELYEKNSDFLSNPLLAAMMLLTYDSFGEIPEKRHIFYAKCFDVLAREHDASKGRYKREIFSGMTMDQLEKTFMFFCAFSYVERTISFTKEQMEDFTREAILACGLNADSTSVIRDFRESISIMELDGLIYEFAHRSFQEYFYARFVVSDRKLSLAKKINWLIGNFDSEDTIEMIADMDRIYFEDEFLLPELKKLNKQIEKIDPQDNPSSIIGKFFNRVHATSLSVEEREKNKRNIYYSHDNHRNVFFFRQAMTKYRTYTRNTVDAATPENWVSGYKAAEILYEKYGGEIKPHHRNNLKLIEVGGDTFAARAKVALKALEQHLEDVQAKRRRGIGSLIRKHYSE